MVHVDDALLDRLFSLARIEVERDPVRREKLKEDLSALLAYFAQLEEINTDSVEPLCGGTLLSHITRDDIVPKDDVRFERDASVSQFPHSENGYLKVLGVFDNDA